MEIIKNQYNAGELVRESRKLSRLNQEELAKQIDRTRESIARVEINNQKMSLNKFLELLEKNKLEFVIYKKETL